MGKNNAEKRLAALARHQTNISIVQHVKEDNADETLAHIFQHSNYLGVSSSGGRTLAKSLKWLSRRAGKASMHWGLIFKFENDTKGDTYWTLYGDRGHGSEKRRDFYVRAHKAPPKNIIKWQYLGFVCASPKSIIEEAQQLKTFTTYNLISRNCQEWAVVFFKHITSKYQLYWYGPKSLGSRYVDREGKLKTAPLTADQTHVTATYKPRHRNNKANKNLKGLDRLMKTRITVHLLRETPMLEHLEFAGLKPLKQVLALIENELAIRNFATKRMAHVSWVQFKSDDSDTSAAAGGAVLIELEASGNIPASYCTITTLLSKSDAVTPTGFSLAYLQEKPGNILPADNDLKEEIEWSLEAMITWYVVLQQWYLNKKLKKSYNNTGDGDNNNDMANANQQFNEIEFVETFFGTLQTVGRIKMPATAEKKLSKMKQRTIRYFRCLMPCLFQNYDIL